MAAPFAFAALLNATTPAAADQDLTAAFAVACAGAFTPQTVDGVAMNMAALGYAPTADHPFSIPAREARMRADADGARAQGAAVEERLLAVAVYATPERYAVWDLSRFLIAPNAAFRIDSYGARCALRSRGPQDYENVVDAAVALYPATEVSPFEDATHDGVLIALGDAGFARLGDAGAQTVRHLIVTREKADPTAVTLTAAVNIVAFE